MKVQISALVKWAFGFFLMIECGIFHLIGIDVPFSDRITLMLTIFMGGLGRFSVCMYPRISKYSRFLNPFMIVYFLFVGLEVAYSLISYSGNGIRVISMIINYRYLLYPLWVYPLLYVIDTEGGWDGLLRLFLTIGIFDNCIRVISYVAYNVSGITIFPSIVELFVSRMRNGRYRLGAGTLHTLAFNIALYYVAVLPKRKQKRKFLLIAAFFFIYQVIVSMGRTQILCYVITLAVYIYCIFLSNSEHGKRYRVIFGFLITMVFLYALGSGYLNSVLSRLFITDRRLSEEAGSTIARLYALKYYWSIVRYRLPLGFGLLYNDGSELAMILRGNESGYGGFAYIEAYTEDLGFLGQFFNYGIIGTCVFGIMMIHWLKIIVKTYRNDNRKEAALLVPLFVHGITQTFTSMSLFQANKFVYIPIYLLIFEYAKYHISNQSMKDRY